MKRWLRRRALEYAIRSAPAADPVELDPSDCLEVFGDHAYVILKESYSCVRCGLQRSETFDLPLPTAAPNG